MELEGTIPTEIGLLTQLVELNITFNNKLQSSTIPTEIGLLTQLTALKMHGNDLQGTIPTEIGLLSTQLVELYLYRNKLVGTIPTEIQLLSNLGVLWLHFNDLNGNVNEILCNPNDNFASIASDSFINLYSIAADCTDSESNRIMCDCCLPYCA